MSRNNINNINYSNWFHHVNLFNLADYFFYKHKTKDLCLSLERLKLYLFIYQIGAVFFKACPAFLEFINIKDGSLFIEDIDRKYKKSPENIIDNSRHLVLTLKGSAETVANLIIATFSPYSENKIKALHSSFIQDIIEKNEISPFSFIFNSNKRHFPFFVMNENTVAFCRNYRCDFEYNEYIDALEIALKPFKADTAPALKPALKQKAPAIKAPRKARSVCKQESHTPCNALKESI